MKKNVAIIFSIFSCLVIVFISFIVIYKKSYFFSNLLNYRDLTKQRYRDNYIISNNLNLDDVILKNEKTLVIFWATWCPYCVKESNALNEYITKNPDVPVIIVSHDKEYSELKKYLDDNHYNWYVIFDKDKTIREKIDTGSTGIPSSYLLNHDLSIKNYHKGEFSLEEFENFFNEIKE